MAIVGVVGSFKEVRERMVGRIPEVTRAHFVSGWRTWLEPGFCPLHDHRWVEIVYHPTGRGWTAAKDGAKIKFGPGSVVMYPPGVAHTQTMTEPGEDVVVKLEVDPLPELFNRALLIPCLREEHLRWDLNILSSPPGGRTPLQQSCFDHRAGALLCALLNSYFQTETVETLPVGEAYADMAFRLVRERYATLRSVADLAEVVGISYDHLRHVFRERYGMTLQEWLIRTRLERAKELLHHSALPLKAIASLCGFGTDRHLCALFHKRVGSSPGRYRKNQG